jgi:hypothetical protein
LKKSTPEARKNALDAFKEIKETFNFADQFDLTIFPDFASIKSQEDLSKLEYNTAI